MTDDKIYFAKVRPDAKIPTREIWNAGVDIYPCFEQTNMVIPPHSTVLVPTGIASAIPADYYIQIYERGSSGSKGIKYSAGVIDSSYRGEWFLAATNTNDKPVLITKLDLEKTDEAIRELIEDAYIVYPYTKALFQGVVHSVHNELEREEIPYDVLKAVPSERGAGKLGSSGK
ncbi:MAG: dUTP pyrophosphatase [Firmicutes bacterium]|nr:dUTP pyrophosphatase [Bacillota bacterium]